MWDTMIKYGTESGTFGTEVVFRGAYNTGVPGQAGTGEWHYAAAGPRPYIHIEPWLLDSALSSPDWKAQLANSVLHEVAHTLYPDQNHSEGVWMGPNTGYSTRQRKSPIPI
jgi:hypothetical protein